MTILLNRFHKSLIFGVVIFIAITALLVCSTNTNNDFYNIKSAKYAALRTFQYSFNYKPKEPKQKVIGEFDYYDSGVRTQMNKLERADGHIKLKAAAEGLADGNVTSLYWLIGDKDKCLQLRNSINDILANKTNKFEIYGETPNLSAFNQSMEILNLADKEKNEDIDWEKFKRLMDQLAKKLEEENQVFPSKLSLYRSEAAKLMQGWVPKELSRINFDWKSFKPSSRPTPKQKRLLPRQIAILTTLNSSSSRVINATYNDDIVIKNRQKYCDKHGYKCVFTDVTKVYKKYQPWYKGIQITDFFNDHEDIKWVWWLDANAFIVDQNVDLVKYILDQEVLEQRLSDGMPRWLPNNEYEVTGPLAWNNYYTLTMNNVSIGYYDAKQLEDGNNNTDIQLIATYGPHGLDTGSVFFANKPTSRFLLAIWVNDLVGSLWPEESREEDIFTNFAIQHNIIKKKLAIVPKRSIDSISPKCVNQISDFYPLYYDNTENWKKLMLYEKGDFVVRFQDCQLRNSTGSIRSEMDDFLVENGIILQ